MKRGPVILISILAIIAIIFLCLFLFQNNKKSQISEQEVEKRRAACNSCPYQETKLGIKACKLCGCNTNLKTEWPDQECPDNPPRWTKVKT